MIDARRIEVFFYGLFMDADLLRAKGADPVKIRPACAPGFALLIGQRATLLRNPDARAYGILMELTHAEIEQLYSEANVRAYRREAVLCELADGSHVPALCFNLRTPRRKPKNWSSIDEHYEAVRQNMFMLMEDLRIAA